MDRVKLVLGTMTFGESVFKDDARDFLKVYEDAGYNEIDTAYVYNNGQSETIIGELMKERVYPFRVSTKVNPRISGKLDGEAAFFQLNESLNRLQTDSVDIFYLHFPDPKTPVVSVLEACQKLYESGKFKELGLSNFPAWMVADVWNICDRNGWIKPTVYQGKYNPLTRTAENELDRCLTYYNIRYYAYNPLAGGLLTGRYTDYEAQPMDGRFTHRPNYQERYWKKSYFDAVNLVRAAAEEEGISIVEATYRWLVFHSMLKSQRDDAVIIGASSLKHLKQNLECVEKGALSEKVIAAFESAWNICKKDCPDYFTFYKG